MLSRLFDSGIWTLSQDEDHGGSELTNYILNCMNSDTFRTTWCLEVWKSYGIKSTENGKIVGASCCEILKKFPSLIHGSVTPD